MEELETTTPAHCDTFNARFQQGIENDVSLYNMIRNVLADGAGAHNSIYRGINLFERYTIDEISQRISDGTFNDLYIGDYFEITISGSFGTDKLRLLMAGFDLFYGSGDEAFTKHHAVIIPQDCLTQKSTMYKSGITTGVGYINSYPVTNFFPFYNNVFNRELNFHLLSHRETFTNSITSGASNAGTGYDGYANGHEWKSCILQLMSEVQLFGVTIYSSSAHDIANGNVQFPLFRLAPELKRAGRGYGRAKTWYWLSAVDIIVFVRRMQ